MITLLGEGSMLDAVCQLDSEISRVYSIFDFQRLPATEIESLRQQLSCVECGGKAYFRKASIDGKSACFGSRYHKDDCKEFHPSAEKDREERHALEVNQLILDSDAVMIDFSLPVKGSNQANKPSKTSAKKVAQSKTSVSGKAEASLDVSVEKSDAKSESGAESEHKLASQGLEKILHSLLRGSDLDKSDLWIYTDEKYRWRAKNLFVNFADAEPTENGAPRMYWGTISHSDKELTWLNPADSKDIGIPIADVQSKLFRRFGIEERRDLEGAGVILFGKCFWNKDKTRKIIQLWGKDIQKCFIAKALDE